MGHFYLPLPHPTIESLPLIPPTPNTICTLIPPDLL